jgi:predicted AAA+ superfamily ATPase
MIDRRITRDLRRRLRRYPAVALLGPRQCGKTTLASVPRSTGTATRASCNLGGLLDRLREAAS